MGHWGREHSSLSWERTFLHPVLSKIGMVAHDCNSSMGIMKFRVIRSVWVISDPVSKNKGI